MVCGVALKIITSYLENNFQCVHTKNVLSGKLEIMCGVPQCVSVGSVLFQHT